MARQVTVTSHQFTALISCCGGEPNFYPITKTTVLASHQVMLLAADDIAKSETLRTGMDHRVVGVRIEIKGSVDYLKSCCEIG